MRCMHCPTSDIGVGSGRLAVAWTTSREHQGVAFFSGTEVAPAGMRSATYRPTPSAPGIPNLMAGEVVTPEAIEFLQATIRVPFGMY